MIELQLVGLHNDDDHIVLIDRDGQRFTLPIDEALRAAVRRDRPRLAQANSEAVRPKEIQTLIRQGHSPEEISKLHGVSIENIQRYEGPVLAEREYVSSRSQLLTLGMEPGAPTLGDIVVDRLAARGATLTRWDAIRDGNTPWNVLVYFEEDGQAQRASWQVDLQTGHIHPLDDHAKALSTQQPERRPGPHSPIWATSAVSVESELAGHQSGNQDPTDPDPLDTEAVLADLDSRRGERPSPEEPDYVEIGEEFNPEDVPGAHPPYSQPDLAQDATILAWSGPSIDLDADAEAEEQTSTKPQSTSPKPTEAVQKSDSEDTSKDEDETAKKKPADPATTDSANTEPATKGPPAKTANTKKVAKRRSSKRTSVPSWDEIVFGTRPEG